MKNFILLLSLTFTSLSYSNTTIIKRLDINLGLSNNYCQGITIDRKGFIWFGTDSGLNRFDGNGFTNYYASKTEKNSIISNELNDIYADKKDDVLWIATERSGLNAYNYSTHRFSHYQNEPNNPNSIGSNGIMSIAGEQSGNLWICTYEAGVDLLDKKTQRFIHYNQSTVKGLKSNFNRCVLDDNQGHLYIGHLQDGLSIITLKNKTAVNFTPNPNNPRSIPSMQVMALFIDSKKRIWIGTDNGLALFDQKNKEFKVFRTNGNPGSLRSNFITTINEINDELWIGTLNGIEILEGQPEMATKPDKVTFKHLSASDKPANLSHHSINSILQDHFKNIWIGTYGGGINFLSAKPAYFHTITHSPTTPTSADLNVKIVLGLCYTSQNELWVGTDGGGIDVFSNGIKVRNLSVENKSLKDNRIMAIFEDSHKNIWIGDATGVILCYNPANKHFTQLHHFNLPNSPVWAFYEDSHHNLWIATENGLYVYNILSGEKKSYNGSPLLHNVVRAISGDIHGRIWVGTLGGGLQIFSPDMQSIKNFSPNNGFYGINHIFRDSKNRMWVSTRQGLMLFKTCDDTTHIIYNQKNGLIDNHIRSACVDGSGKIWLGTNRGLSCIDVKTKTIRNFNKYDGISPGSFTAGAVAKSKDGNIYFGSETGICYFNSYKPFYTFAPPAVTITSFTVLDNKNTYTGNFTDIPVAKSIDLSYNQNTFTVSFNLLDYSLNDITEFSYQLKGLDDTWYNIKNEKSLVFRQLRPGKYVLSLKVRLRNMEWSNKITTLEINIHPPFWFSWWAETIYMLIFLFITVYIVRFYKNKVNLENSLMYEKKTHQQEQKLNKERLRFYTNIAHELRTPLTLIIGPLEDIAANRNLEPILSKKINSIYRSANRLLDLINQILEFRKSEASNRRLSVTFGNISSLVIEIGLKYKELNQNKAVEISVVVPPVPEEIYYDSEVITIILDNLVSNALKYTPTGSILLELRHKSDAETQLTEIVVSDSGYGISEEAITHIFEPYYQANGEHQMPGTGIGLSLVKNMVELHQGHIRVDSIIGKGTKFSFSILSQNKYPDAKHAKVEEKQPLPKEDISVQTNLLMLVVEDNEEIRNYISECFADSFEVVAASDGKIGLELALERIPDIIISDIMMPMMDGMELCRRIKEEVKTSHIPVILLTAKDSIQDKTEGYNLGADSYLTKPFSTQLLQSRVTNLLDSRKKINLLFASNTKKQVILADSLNKLDNEFIEKVTAAIEENLESEQINIGQLAQRLNMSHSTLYRKLKAVTGLSVNEFSRKIKMKEAEKLLLTGKYTINEIVFMVGMNSSNYFRECFKEEFGTSPKKYLQDIKGSKNKS